MIKLPNEILEYIKLFIPFNIMKNIRRESNEFRKAKLITPTGSSHCMYLMIIRFIWRWNYSSISLAKPIIINELNIEIPKFYSKSYETVFINNSLESFISHSFKSTFKQYKELLLNTDYSIQPNRGPPHLA